jgi:hypothetical protein
MVVLSSGIYAALKSTLLKGTEFINFTYLISYRENNLT